MGPLGEKTIIQDRMFVSRLPATASSALIVAPLIDVFFLLLIFVVLGAGLVYSQGIMIDPPSVDTASYETADKLVIAMRPFYDEDGNKKVQIFFQNKSVQDYAKLENQLRDAIGPNSQDDRLPTIIFRADREVDLEEISQVLAICRKLRLRVFIPTKSK